MGNPFVGMVHPCKIYNVLSTGAPVLYIGPAPSSVSEVLARIGDTQLWGAAEHGEVEKVVAHIRRIRAARLRRTGHEHDAIAAEYSREKWLPRLVGVLEGKAEEGKAESRKLKAES